MVTPFLPGDSLLFVAGALAEGGIFDLTTLFIVCAAGAILGDTVNYWIGARIGESALEGRFAVFIHKEWIDKTHSFFCRYGGLTIIIARFIPYLRTFAPFLAGLGEMRYRSFLAYNVVGGILWTGGILLAGYYFGGLPIIRDNLTFLMLIVLILCALAVVMILHRLIALSLVKKKNGE